MHTKAPATAANAVCGSVTSSGTITRADREQDNVADVALETVAEKRPRRRVGERLYQETWETVAHRFFEPERLEKWQRWQHKFDGQIKSVASSMEFANQMLKSLKDPYTELTPRSFEVLTNDKEPVVSTMILPENIGYVRLTSFYPGTTASQLRHGLLEVSGCRGIVLDLRGNGGGSTDQAIACAQLFLDRGGIVTYESRIWRSNSFRRTEFSLEPNRLLKKISSGESVRVISSKRKYRRVLKKSMPVVVLVDSGSASSSELLLGALKDNGRVLVIGTPTFGKGIGQSVFKHMPNGTELSVTTFKYYTPNGHWAGDAHRGRNPIQPDWHVEGRGRIYRSSLKRDKQLSAAWEHLAA